MNERDYKAGDHLLLQEFDQTVGQYTGREQLCIITYVTNRNTPCAMSSVALDRNHTVLSIEKVEND